MCLHYKRAVPMNETQPLGGAKTRNDLHVTKIACGVFYRRPWQSVLQSPYPRTFTAVFVAMQYMEPNRHGVVACTCAKDAVTGL